MTTSLSVSQVRQIHRRLPPGGILVFVTGQREVEHLVQKLRSALSPAATAAPDAAASAAPAEEVSTRQRLPEQRYCRYQLQ